MDTSSSLADERPLIQHPGASRVAALVAACILGGFALYPSLRFLLRLWSADALRSVGALIALASIALIARVWSTLRWQTRPSWWGVSLILIAAIASRITADGWIVFHFAPRTSVQLLQPGLLVCMAMTGIVLVLGGTGLARACIFPLALLLFVDPIPHAFNKLVDLPLQQLSAETARRFSHLLGLRPTGEDLQMMFTPHFGMMIVPGCNGIRGALTLGYLALILAWLDRFRAWKIAACVTGAVVLGYLLNLLRLCLLVIYYWAGTHVVSWQRHGEGVDYAIGGTIFLIASATFGVVFFRRSSETAEHQQPWRPMPWRWQPVACLLSVLAIFGAYQVRADWARGGRAPLFRPYAEALSAMPSVAGPWKRSRIWTEDDGHGHPGWVWGEFARPDGRLVHFGFWNSPIQHFAIESERAHGRYPVWTSSLATHDQQNRAVRFATFAATDPDRVVPPAYSAEATCRINGCSQFTAGFGKVGFSMALADGGAGKRLEILVRVPGVEASDAGDPVAADFTRNLNLHELVAAAGTSGLD